MKGKKTETEIGPIIIKSRWMGSLVKRAETLPVDTPATALGGLKPSQILVEVPCSVLIRGESPRV